MNTLHTTNRVLRAVDISFMFLRCVATHHPSFKSPSLSAAGRNLLLPYAQLCADVDTTIEIDHVVIHETETTGRDCLAYGLRGVGSVNAIYGISKVHRARAKRITRTSGHETGQIRLPLDHFRWRVPIRPF